MEAQPDVETGTEPVRRGTKRASSTWEDCAVKSTWKYVWILLERRGACERSACRPPTDKEKDESEIMHMTIRSQCETEDSH